MNHDSQKSTSALYNKAFLINFIPLSLTAAPLFFHQSETPQIGLYSYPYFSLLIAIVISIFIACTLFAKKAQQAKNYHSPFLFLTLILTLSFCFLTTEIILRLKNQDNFYWYRYWGHQKAIPYGFEMQPSLHQTQQRPIDGKNITFTTDKYGFRTNLHHPRWSSAKTTKRMFVLGGSSAFGHELDDSETWAHLLQGQLQRDQFYSGVDIINAGNRGHFSNQTLMRLYFKVLLFHPDAVLLYQNINDVSETKLEPTQISATKDMLFSQTVAQYWKTQRPRQNIYRQSLIALHLHKFRKKIHHEKNASAEFTDYKNIAINNANNYLRNVRTMSHLCRIHQVPFILTTFLIDDQNINPYQKECVSYHNDLIRALAREENIPLIDLAEKFKDVKNKDLYFAKDSYHPNVKGSEFIATETAKEIKRRGLLKLRN